MIAIIDYGAGNIHNVKSILEYLGQEVLVTSNPDEVRKADKVVLPGVGNFGFIMKSLKKSKLDKAILESISLGKPFLGICIGYQVLFERSEEDRSAKGLCVFKGSVVKFRKGKVPHVGWNTAIPKNAIFDDGYAYFVHSYYPKPTDKKMALFHTDYEERFCSGIMKDNVLAVQFHPERSGQWGIGFYRKWLKMSDALLSREKRGLEGKNGRF